VLRDQKSSTDPIAILGIVAQIIGATVTLVVVARR
jgi:hypothetical protein